MTPCVAIGALTFNQEVMGSNPIALTNEIKDLYGRLNIKSEPETSSGQRSGQHSADFVAGRPAPCPALTLGDRYCVTFRASLSV
jgi:hypothetical protein